MHKLYQNLLILLIISLTITFNSCEKTDVNPQLQITVLDINNNKVNGATVELYNSLEDWDGRINKIANSSTNNDGIVIFSDLNEIVYYFYAVKDSLNNSESGIMLKDPLQKNKLVKILTTIN